MTMSALKHYLDLISSVDSGPDLNKGSKTGNMTSSYFLRTRMGMEFMENLLKLPRLVKRSHKIICFRFCFLLCVRCNMRFPPMHH